MMRKTKNISMFFAHAISLSLLAMVFLANGCAGINSVTPEVVLVQSDDNSVSTNSKLLEQDDIGENLNGISVNSAEGPKEHFINDASNDPSSSGSGSLQADKPVLNSKQQNSGEQREIAYSESALVDRIEFSGLPAGKSILTVGTTRPIRYDIKKVQNKKLVLQLFDTRLPENQKRPLITTRFESAVDRVLPIQTASMNDSILSIELRENVGYQADQTDNVLQIRFDASSISPKPLEAAGLPSWKERMAPNQEDSSSPEMVSASGASDLAGEGSITAQPEILQNPGYSELFEPRKEYTGEKIALDFFETDIRNVFRILREVSGKNFAIDRDVTGTVTLTLEQPVPWDQILDLILKMNQLGKVEENDVVRIARVATITAEQDELRSKFEAQIELKKKEKAAEPLITEYFAINYSDAINDVLPKLCEIATLTEDKESQEMGNSCTPSDGPEKKIRGSISVDKRTNMVIMVDTEAKIQHAREIVQRLDAVTPQVIIEARIVEVTSSFSREIGIEWGVRNSKSSDTLGGIWGFDSAVNLPVEEPTGSIGFDFSRLTGSPLLIDARLTAAESQGEGKIVSAPKVMTLNNKQAVIKQGREIPYSVIGSDGMVQTEFKEVDLRLEVTPHVTPDDRITLRILITKDEVADFSVDGIPSLATKRAETELLVNDGETIVIGGIFVSNELDITDSVPVLGEIPVLKWLFKKDAKTNRKEELLIFLTPRIMRLEQKNVVSYQN